MNRQEDRSAIPDWKLERYLLGELPSEELEGIRREARQSRALRERLDALERSDLEIRDRYPPGWMARRIREKADVSARTAPVGAGRFPSRLWPMPALPALALGTVAGLAAGRLIAPERFRKLVLILLVVVGVMLTF